MNWATIDIKQQNFTKTTQDDLTNITHCERNNYINYYYSIIKACSFYNARYRYAHSWRTMNYADLFVWMWKEGKCDFVA